MTTEDLIDSAVEDALERAVELHAGPSAEELEAIQAMNAPGRPRFARLGMERLPPWIRVPHETDAAATLEDK